MTVSDSPVSPYSARNDFGRETKEIPVSEIVADREQPRELFEEEEIAELAQSIARHGLINPITVRYVEDSHFAHYVIVAGERRFRSVKLLGLADINCTILRCSEDDASWIALSENFDRKDLNPIEAARGIQKQMQRHPSLTESAVATMLGKSQSWINNKLRLLNLPDSARRCLSQGAISEAHGKALAGLHGYPREIAQLVVRIIDEGISSKQTEVAVAEIKRTMDAAERDAVGQNALPLGLDDDPSPATDETVDDDAPAVVEADDEGFVVDQDDPAQREFYQTHSPDKQPDKNEDPTDPPDTASATPSPRYQEVYNPCHSCGAAPATSLKDNLCDFCRPPDMSELNRPSGPAAPVNGTRVTAPAPKSAGLTIVLSPRSTAILVAINDKRNASNPKFEPLSLEERIDLMINVYAGQTGIDTESFGE